MKMRQLACAIVGVMALGGLAGCESTHHTRSEGRALDDKHITERVKDELKGDPVYKFTDINVDTYGGLVQLSGFVNIDAQKKRAQDVAESVPGVMRVDNGITLKPQPMAPTGRTTQDNRIYSQ